jgi:myo-inositol-1-phosphate synthase
MAKVRVGVIGVGNCCSALVQGINYYAGSNNSDWVPGVMHPVVGGYGIGDISVVAAFDVDSRKVGRPLSEAIFAPPNCTTVFQRDIKTNGTLVSMGAVHDGVAAHMTEGTNGKTFEIASEAQPSMDEVVDRLVTARTDVVINYLPVGSEKASRWYAECALKAGAAFVNCMPTLIASDPAWAERFRAAGLPIIGDDIKSQVGATIVHRELAELFSRRGAALDRTYQINVGGNTDFRNMQDMTRLQTKKLSKSEAVQTAARTRIPANDLHVGPSDFVPWLNDNKVAFIRMEGRLFGDVPMHLEMRLSVEDSPNSAGVAVDMIRCAKLARDRGIAGVLLAPSAFLCKHPPVQMAEHDAFRQTEQFIDFPST